LLFACCFIDSASSANKAARSRRKQAEQEKAEREQALRNEGNLKLAAKLLKQRQERDAESERLRQEEELIANKRMFLGAAKNMLEETHFMQQEMGAERQANNRQLAVQKVRKSISNSSHINN